MIVARRCFVVALGLTVACVAKHPYQWAENVSLEDVEVEELPLDTGDTIQVQVHNWEELREAQSYTVNADGAIVLPLVGRLIVAGKTIDEVAGEIDARLKGIIVGAQVRVSIVSPRTPIVTVLGEVRNPGRFEVSVEEGLLAVLALAGGLTEFASLTGIYVLRQEPTPLRVRFRYGDLTAGVTHSVKFHLHDGDVVVVE